MHVWEQKNSKNKHFSEKWVPYVFVKSKTGKFKSIYGDVVSLKQFKNYHQYKDFCENNKNVFENKVRPEIQYLAEKYHVVEDKDLSSPNIKTYFLDIEVAHEQGFPHASKAEYSVCLISIRDNLNNKTITFGEKEYTGNSENVVYIHCPSEKELLRKFFAYMNKYPPHVISGWNVYGFDIPYLINRDKVINNGNYYNGLSPINVVRTWKSKSDSSLNVDIAGITILDYMDVYKWYSPNNLERYSLDYVSNFELGEGKLDYSDDADDLKELYKNNWNKYVDYNIIDCERVLQLEQKLAYIRLIQMLSLLTRTPMKYYDAATISIEGAMLTHYRRNELCAPTMFGGSQKWFEAAYVKEPEKGMHSWIFSIDIQSSYPSHLITLNMSVETYFGRIAGLNEETIINCSKKNKFPGFSLIKPSGIVDMRDKKLNNFNRALKQGMFSIAPCGTIFVNKKKGVISTVERNFFEKRLEVKKLMRESEGNEKERYRAIQQALKILLNSVYGIMAVPYSRYFNPDIAEAITSCGRYTIKSGERFVNDLMNNPDNKMKEILKGVASG